jgi:secreted trypsin-like serine protease
MIKRFNLCCHSLFCVAVLKCANCNAEFTGKVDVPLDNPNQRIINGEIATRGQFPWQVAITTDNHLFCGGSLISWEWVLTAAQCV